MRQTAGLTFDFNGYPTKATLEKIEKWPMGDFVALMEYVQEAWKYPDRFQRKKGKTEIFKEPCYFYYLSTGGWSGHEEIMGALSKNFIFWNTCWVKSTRGGHYKFEVKI